MNRNNPPVPVLILPCIIFSLVACGSASDPSSPRNSAPTASFSDWDYEVRGAELAAANQHYYESGESRGRIRYSGDGDPSYELYAGWMLEAGNIWVIDESWVEFPSSLEDIEYYIQDSENFPPSEGWLAGGDGSVSGLRVVEVPIDGDVSSYGNTLSAVYRFVDPDGDAEGDSRYQWYHSENEADEGTAIADATGLSYTTTGEDDLKYLKIEVTPVDEHGLAGESVKSEASRIIGST